MAFMFRDKEFISTSSDFSNKKALYVGIQGEIYSPLNKYFKENVSSTFQREDYSGIILDIDSVGGDVATGLEVGYSLKELKNNGVAILAYTETYVQSSALLPYFSSTVRVMHPNAQLLFHPLEYKHSDLSLRGYEKQKIEWQLEQKTYELADFISKDTTLSRNDILELYSKENKLSAQEALKRGLIDIIQELPLPAKEERVVILTGQKSSLWLY